MEKLSKQVNTECGKRSPWVWITGGGIALLLILSALFHYAGKILSSPTVKQKIQQAFVKKAGVEIDWQLIDLDYIPYPAITLQQVSLAVNGRMQGEVAEVRIVPEVKPLLTGDIRLAGIVLNRPDIRFDLPEPESVNKSAQAYSLDELQEKLAFSIKYG